MHLLNFCSVFFFKSSVFHSVAMLWFLWFFSVHFWNIMYIFYRINFVRTNILCIDWTLVALQKQIHTIENWCNIYRENWLYSRINISLFWGQNRTLLYIQMLYLLLKTVPPMDLLLLSPLMETNFLSITIYDFDHIFGLIKYSLNIVCTLNIRCKMKKRCKNRHNQQSITYT